MLFMVVPLLGVDFKPAAGLEYYFAFSKPSRGRVDESGSMAEKKVPLLFLFRKIGWGGGKNTKENALPRDFLFFSRLTVLLRSGLEKWLKLTGRRHPFRHSLYSTKRGWGISFFAYFLKKKAIE